MTSFVSDMGRSVGVRSKAMSASTVANWGANVVVAATFLSLGSAIPTQGVFYLYAVIAVAAFFFFAARVPETKDRSLEVIEEELTDVVVSTDLGQDEAADVMAAAGSGRRVRVPRQPPGHRA